MDRDVVPAADGLLHARTLSRSVVSDSEIHGLSPANLLCPWDFPGKITGVGCHFLLPDPGIKPASPALQADSLPSEPLGSSYKGLLLSDKKEQSNAICSNMDETEDGHTK